MIPARLGSQRLKHKNLQLINGVPLITHTIRKCLNVDTFDAVWVNSESEKIGEIAEKEGQNFICVMPHLRIITQLVRISLPIF